MPILLTLLVLWAFCIYGGLVVVITGWFYDEFCVGGQSRAYRRTLATVVGFLWPLTVPGLALIWAVLIVMFLFLWPFQWVFSKLKGVNWRNV